MAINTNEVYSVVKQQIIEDLPDGLQHASAHLNNLVKNKERMVGGIYLQFPIKVLKNAASGFVAGNATTIVDVSPSIQLQYGTSNWRYYYVAANFSLQDYNVAQNSKEAVRNFILDKTNLAIEDAMRDIASIVWTGNAADTLKVTGLANICAASGTALYGLTDTDFTDDTTAYLPYISTDTVINYGSLARLINESRARRKVDSKEKYMGLMNTALFTKMQIALQNQQLFINSKELAEAGFENFVINGVPFALDYYGTGSQDGSTGDNWVVIYPEKNMKFIYNYGFGSESPMDGTIRIPNTPIDSVQTWMTFEQVCNNRRLVGVCKTYVA
jgi:hypothetical protein